MKCASCEASEEPARETADIYFYVKSDLTCKVWLAFNESEFVWSGMKTHSFIILYSLVLLANLSLFSVRSLDGLRGGWDIVSIASIKLGNVY